MNDCIHCCVAWIVVLISFLPVSVLIDILTFCVYPMQLSCKRTRYWEVVMQYNCIGLCGTKQGLSHRLQACFGDMIILQGRDIHWPLFTSTYFAKGQRFVESMLQFVLCAINIFQQSFFPSLSNQDGCWHNCFNIDFWYLQELFQMFRFCD